MISFDIRPLHTQWRSGTSRLRPCWADLLQVLNFSSTIHLFTQLCLNQFNWKIINHPDSSWTSLKQNQIEFMFGIRKIPPAVDVIKCKVVLATKTPFFPEGSFDLFGWSPFRAQRSGQLGLLQPRSNLPKWFVAETAEPLGLAVPGSLNIEWLVLALYGPKLYL